MCVKSSSIDTKEILTKNQVFSHCHGKYLKFEFEELLMKINTNNDKSLGNHH